MNGKYLFIDRDGTLLAEPDDKQVDSLDKWALVRGVIPALLRFKAAGYRFVLVSNQDGLGSASFPRKDFDPPQKLLLDTLASQGVEFESVRICEHIDADRCACRKPRVGLLMDFLRDTAWNRAQSAVIGDRATDLELAENLGIRGCLLNEQNDWASVAEALLNLDRNAQVLRNTNETQVRVAVNLDQDAPVNITTGIAFLDHMLEQVAVHGGFALEVCCQGDLSVDDHHSVEDVALSLGEAVRRALGDRRGIGRYGFVLPMDESLAQAALDLSGRPCCRVEADFPAQRVGGMATEMVLHFFGSLAQALGAALHLSVRGENTHHMVEALFKATGRCLRQAVQRGGGDVPSSKGMLT